VSFVAAVAALVYAVADVSVGEALPEQATVAGARRAPTGGAFLVRGVDDFVDPVDVARHFGVHARPVGSGAAVAVAGHSLQTPTPVRFPAHQRSSGVSETSVASSAIESGAEHVVGQSVKRQEQCPLAALFRRHQR